MILLYGDGIQGLKDWMDLRGGYMGAFVSSKLRMMLDNNNNNNKWLQKEGTCRAKEDEEIERR